MKAKNNRLILIVALLVALAAGFGLAKLTGGRSGAAHADNDGHSSQGDDQQAESHTAHGAENGHAEDGGHADEGEKDEGLIALTPQQVEASGIRVVALGRGGGSATRLSGRVEPTIGARASVAASIGVLMRFAMEQYRASLLYQGKAALAAQPPSFTTAAEPPKPRRSRKAAPAKPESGA